MLRRQARLIGEIGHKGGIYNKSGRGDGNCGDVRAEQAQYLAQSGVREIPGEEIARFALHNARDLHSYMEESTDQHTTSGAIDAYFRDRQRKEQPANQS